MHKNLKDIYGIGFNDGKPECVIHIHECMGGSYRFTLAWDESGTEVFYSKDKSAMETRFEKESEFFDEVVIYGE